jgi:hypothetical protein
MKITDGLLAAAALVTAAAAALSTPAAAVADEPAPQTGTPSEPATPAATAAPSSEAPARPYDLHFSLLLPFATHRPSELPSSFESDPDSVLPPFLLAASWDPQPDENHAATFQVEGRLAFTRTSILPFAGLTPKVAFRLGPYAQGTAGIDTAIQTTLSQAPLKDSQFDTWIVAPRAGLQGNPLPWLTVGADLRLILPSRTRIASFESLPTESKYDATWELSPRIEARLPFELAARATLDIYRLGAVAVASKEVAISNPVQNALKRLTLGFEKRLGRLGLEARYAWVLGVTDRTALAYQAPFLDRDYLLSPQTLTMGVSWNL